MARSREVAERVRLAVACAVEARGGRGAPEAYAAVCREVGRLALAHAWGEQALAGSAVADWSQPWGAEACSMLGALGPEDCAAVGDGYVAALEAGGAGTAGNGRKVSGSYYTPPELVERLLELALEPLLAACDDEAALIALRVCDPACGSGHFLLAALERLARRLARLRGADDSAGKGLGEAKADPLLLGCLVGFERDPFAAEVCAARLAYATGAPRLDTSGLRRCVHPTDTLLEPAGEASVVSDYLGRCDVVLGNPPWVSYAGRHAAKAEPGWLDALVRRYPAIRGWKALHSAFLLRSLELAKEDGGHVGLVLPLPVRYHVRYRAVRQAAQEACERVAVYDVGEEAFDGVEQAAGLFHLVRGAAPERDSASRGVHGGADEAWPVEPAEVPPGKVPPGKVPPGKVPPGKVRSRCLAGGGASEEAFAHVLAALQKRKRMPKALFGDSGVHSGNVAKRLIVRRDASEVERAPDAYAPVRQGRDVRAYWCGPAQRCVWVAPVLAEGEYCRVRELAHYAGVPVLIRQTASRPVAARHTGRTYFRNSLLACYELPNVATEVLLAVLNSALLALWHRATAGDATQRTFPQVKMRHLRNLPLFAPPASAVAKDLTQQVCAREAAEQAGTLTAAQRARSDLELERAVLELYALDPALAPALLERAERRPG